jgi:hypothetical protein
VEVRSGFIASGCFRHCNVERRGESFFIAGVFRKSLSSESLLLNQKDFARPTTTVVRNSIEWDYIRQPQLQASEVTIVEIEPHVDFVYIMRLDGEFTISPIAQRMATRNKLVAERVKHSLLEEYETFFHNLADSLRWGFSQKGTFELHVYDPNELDMSVRQRAIDMPTVSLDPLISHEVHSLKVSRAYYLGGKKYIGQIARPGNPSLDVQAQQIAENVNGKPVCVVEDDVFSGGSISASLDALRAHGVTILKVIPGIQVGTPEKLTKSGLIVDPVVKYQTTDGIDIFDRVDLGDPRVYLVGASGLVVHLPNGEYGRAPYILPFVSSTARSSIPAESEYGFALKVLQANLDFFTGAEQKVGKPLLLHHMDEHFMNMMHDLYGFEENSLIAQIVTWALDNIDSIWEITQLLVEDAGAIN